MFSFVELEYVSFQYNVFAIGMTKGYRDRNDFLRFVPGLFSSWRSNTSKKNPPAVACVYWFERIEVWSCERFFMAQGGQAVVSGRSMPTLPCSHFVRRRS